MLPWKNTNQRTELMDNTIFTIITILLYFAIAGYQFLLLKNHDDSHALKLALITTLPLLCHGWLLHLSIDTEHGQNLSIFNIVSMIFWIISSLVIASSITRKLGILVTALLPLSGLTLLASHYLTKESLIDVSAPAFLIHTLISIATISVISLVAIQSLFVNVLDNRLKQNSSQSIQGMPALQDMENFLFILIWIGFTLLSFLILTAIFFMPQTGAEISLHKPILSIASWITFAILLIGRHKNGWRGKMASRWAIAGFIFIFLAYFGTKAVLELILGR
ncbi:MAG: ABC-type uncharacterized transport system permease subunit [Enterobacterales bacterium]|jgi:ABC-type uncharacterized transport system permease subunit